MLVKTNILSAFETHQTANWTKLNLVYNSIQGETDSLGSYDLVNARRLQGG